MLQHIETTGVSQAVNDLLAWHGRVLARVFYPTVPADAARMSLPPSVSNLHTLLAAQGGQGAADLAARIQKLILVVRDAGAAMAAQAVLGNRPDYRSYTEFESYFRDLFTILAHVQQGDVSAMAGGIQPLVNAPQKVIQTKDTETPLQRLVREKRASARPPE